jgi:hypothetical protein
MTLAILSSGLQLLNLKEFLFKEKIQNLVLILLYKNDIEKDQFIFMSKSLDLEINFLLKRKPIFTYFNLVTIKMKLLFSKFTCLIIGNLNDNHILFLQNIIKIKKTVIVDDGTETLLNALKYKKLGYKKIFFLKLCYPPDLIFFSFFDSIKNEINFLKNNFEYSSGLNLKKLNTNKIYFIGQPYLNMISESAYYENVKKISEKYGLRLYYIPHRLEEKSFIDKLKNKLNIRILRTKSIIEYDILKSNELPERVISFNSTALITLKILSKKLNFDMDFFFIEIPNFQIFLYNMFKENYIKSMKL